MECEHTSRPWFGVGVVAKQNLGVRRDVFEPALRRVDAQPFGSLGDVAVRLIGVAAERRPSGLRLDDATELLVDEKTIVGGAGVCSEFAHGDTCCSAQIQL